MWQKKSETAMLNTSLFDYSDAYILVEGRITVVGQGAGVPAVATDRIDKEVVFKNCALFVKCVNKINNAEVGTAEDFDIAVLMYNLLEYIENYINTSASLLQCCRDEPDNNKRDCKLFKFKVLKYPSITNNTNLVLQT